VTLHDIWFEQADGGGYLNELDENLGLPRPLTEGEQLVISFHAEDIEPDTTALVLRDTHRREHRLEFTPEITQQVDGFREFIAESDPRLFEAGQARMAPTLRRSLSEKGQERRSDPDAPEAGA
jgi:hypothetical protein